jgi:hypothetical protein
METRRQWTRIGVGIIVGILVLIGGFMYVGPKYTLYKANTTKQSVIKEQQARSEAAEFEARSRVTQATAHAEAEVIEARGLAESQQIIAETLTDEYLRYLYIRALESIKDGDVIYVPTEAGLPVTEAGRATEGG